MRMILRYQSGVRVEAILLAIDGQWMRVAIKCSDDAAMFVRSSDCWYSENGEVVEIDATAFDGNTTPVIPAEETPKLMSAGGFVVS